MHANHLPVRIRMIFRKEPMLRYSRHELMNFIFSSATIIIIIMIVMHRPQKEYDVHVLISYIYKLNACDS